MTDIISKEDQIATLERVLKAAKDGSLRGLALAAVADEVICCFVDTGGHYHLFDELTETLQSEVYEQKGRRQ